MSQKKPISENPVQASCKHLIALATESRAHMVQTNMAAHLPVIFHSNLREKYWEKKSTLLFDHSPRKLSKFSRAEGTK